MRELNIGTKKYTRVIAIDQKEFNANHEYIVVLPADPTKPTTMAPLTRVLFQKGPIKEAGVNGCHNEDLIAMVLDRLQSFQSSEYHCRENALAITKLEEALFWLRARTDGREARGVEGTHAV